VRGREEVSLSIDVIIATSLSASAPTLQVIVANEGAEKPAVSPDGGFQCWPSSPVQPINRFVQIFRCIAKATPAQIKDLANWQKVFIFVDNSRFTGYYRIKHFGFFQGAVVR
jgi:hypothetical protein